MHARDVESCWVFERPVKGRVLAGETGGLPRDTTWRVCARLEDGPRPQPSEEQADSSAKKMLSWHERNGGWAAIVSAGQAAKEDLERLDAALDALPTAVRGCPTPRWGPAAQARVRSTKKGLTPPPMRAAERDAEYPRRAEGAQTSAYRKSSSRLGRHGRPIDVDPATRKRKVVVDPLALASKASDSGGTARAATSRR